MKYQLEIVVRACLGDAWAFEMAVADIEFLGISLNHVRPFDWMHRYHVFRNDFPTVFLKHIPTHGHERTGRPVRSCAGQFFDSQFLK